MSSPTESLDIKSQAQELIRELDALIQKQQLAPEAKQVGTIVSVKDGVVTAQGLSGCAMAEELLFPHGIRGMVLNLKKDAVGAIVFGDYTKLKEGDPVEAGKKLPSVPSDQVLLGRVVNALGEPIDDKGPIRCQHEQAVERVAPNVMERVPVNTPLQTGIMAIDVLTPIGRGQRELIIGDRSTGKTALAIDTIINQGREAREDTKVRPVFCIYVAIGQKMSAIAQLVDRLESAQAMEYTCIVAAPASDSAAMQYLAPFAGTAMGEHFLEKGQDALIIYDDLTKHAWAYRQISLILERPPGREAFPGDIFYLHSRLLERACKLSPKRGNGSLTAIPLVETQAGDVSAYIPTNIISITDGQIYLETDLFNAGVRPAVNAGLSVSRVGGAAQVSQMKAVAGTLRLDLAQYQELAAFAQFGSELDEATQKRLARGKLIVEILKQPQYQPLRVREQIGLLTAVTQGYLDEVAVDKIAEFKQRFIEHLETRSQHEKMEKIIERFMADFAAHNPDRPSSKGVSKAKDDATDD